MRPAYATCFTASTQGVIERFHFWCIQSNCSQCGFSSRKAVPSVLPLKFIEKFDTSKNGLRGLFPSIYGPTKSRALMQSQRNFLNHLQGQDTSRPYRRRVEVKCFSQERLAYLPSNAFTSSGRTNMPLGFSEVSHTTSMGIPPRGYQNAVTRSQEGLSASSRRLPMYAVATS
jgi:hypothetical protein